VVIKVKKDAARSEKGLIIVVKPYRKLINDIGLALEFIPWPADEALHFRSSFRHKT
jgi:hypothetical protein